MEVLWLADSQAADVSQVGGKVAGLHGLGQHFRVPDGFCLCAEAFRRWDGTDGLPEDLANTLVTAYGRLAQTTGDSAPRVAVRSSAVDEDGQGSSFAGQYETFLNVVGPEALLCAILACWQSARSARVAAYRDRTTTAAAGPGLAVLVQLLVPADVSGVVFSANPLNGDTSEIVINSNWGLGESVVSGETTPDNFVVNRQDLSIKTRHIVTKQYMSINADNGTRTVPVPRLLRQRASLTDAQIQELARLALSLEETTGYPVDVETAYQGSQLFLLQCRPITTMPLPVDTGEK